MASQHNSVKNSIRTFLSEILDIAEDFVSPKSPLLNIKFTNQTNISPNSLSHYAHIFWNSFSFSYKYYSLKGIHQETSFQSLLQIQLTDLEFFPLLTLVVHSGVVVTHLPPTPEVRGSNPGPYVGRYQLYRTLTNYMYWFPLSIKLPVVI